MKWYMKWMCDTYIITIRNNVRKEFDNKGKCIISMFQLQ